MKHMVLMYTDPAHTRAMSKADLDVVARKHERLRNELTESGELLSGAGVVFPEETTLLRLGEEGVVVEQGPLTTGPVAMTAYYVFDCETAERVRSIAEGILDDHVTAVEVRRIHDSVGL
jgi:hypothetical protein